MSKKLWSVDLDSGILTRHYEGDVDDLTCDLTVLFEEFCTMEPVQQRVIVNGLKQRLADTTARTKDAKLSESEKREVQDALWQRMSVEREYLMPSEGGQRGPSVSLKTLVPALIQAGLDEAAIAAATGKTVEQIKKFLETGEE